MRKRTALAIWAGALIVIVGVAEAIGGPAKTTPTASPTSKASTHTASPSAVKSGSEAPIAPTASFGCVGSAPDGLTITYGSDSSTSEIAVLPFDKTKALDPHAQYYVTTVQLNGSGAVSCTTVVSYTDAGGTAHTVTKVATAEGGYSIGTAEICSEFDGSWQTC